MLYIPLCLLRLLKICAHIRYLPSSINSSEWSVKTISRHRLTSSENILFLATDFYSVSCRLVRLRVKEKSIHDRAQHKDFFFSVQKFSFLFMKRNNGPSQTRYFEDSLMCKKFKRNSFL